MYYQANKCNSNIMNKYNVDICFWNVGGLQFKNNDKVNDPCIIQQIGKHDTILLAETHV